VKVVKNKLAPPFKNVEFDLMYGEGISKTGDLLDMGVQLEVIDKSGSWYSYNGERMGQGRENVKIFLKDNPDIFSDIELKVREKLGIGTEAKAEQTEESNP
jgi:recombination protein RecA